MSEDNNTFTGVEIAVIGMACRFPGAQDIDQFWENLKNGVESISSFSEAELEEAGVSPEMIKNTNFVNAKGIIGHIEDFDAIFFNYSPREAEIMDPQLRVFHECAWEAMEHSGYVPQTYPGAIGLYAGAAPNLFWEALVYLSAKSQILGHFASRHFTSKDHLCMRISYKLNLKGPAVSLYTACSTSLVAIDQACRGLLTGHCDMALAGGITLSLPQKTGYFFQEGLIASPDGHCRAFDASALGTVAGDGAGIVVLKRFEDALADRNFIHAVIRGFATNNDGSTKIGYTAPSIEGQANVIRAAQHMGEINPESIGYIEAHGTATVIGDPIEIEALKLAFNTQKKSFCAVGSVKTNFGHLDCAAGAAGFIKTVLALKHKLIPPSLHFKTSNPKIDFENSPFYVNATLTAWANKGYPLRAGVSAFGVGGTNAHIILEEAPEPLNTSTEKLSKMLILSAKTQKSLDNLTKNMAEFFKKNKDCALADAAYTLQLGRGEYQFRRMLVCRSSEEAASVLGNLDSRKIQTYCMSTQKRPVIFMFPGLGAQYVNMGLQLYQTEPVFRHEMDRCFAILHSLADVDVKQILYPGEAGDYDFFPKGNATDAKNLAEISQVVIFSFEYSLAQLLLNWGVIPYAMIGYSLGEYVAATLAGIFFLEDIIKLIVMRERLIKQLPPGGMLSAPLTKEELKPFMNNNLSLAIDNGASCIVSGPSETIDAFEQQMKNERYLCMRLQTSYAGHSSQMKPILEEYEKEVAKVTLNKPQIPYISNVTGDWITDEEAVKPAYWAAHLEQTVQFAAGINKLLKLPDAIFVEIGPGRDLSTSISRFNDATSNHAVINLVRAQAKDVPDDFYLLNNVGKLWLYGIKIDWAALYTGEKRQRIPLPTYPFDRQRYWIEGNPFRNAQEMLAKNSTINTSFQETDLADTPEKMARQKEKASLRLTNLTSEYAGYRDDDEKNLVEIWQNFFGFEKIGIHDDFFEMGGDSLKAILLISRIHMKYNVNIPLLEIFNNPTIAQLVKYIKTIEKESVTINDKQLIYLKKGDNKNGFLFFIHDGTGEVDSYVDFCNLFETPFNCWGIRADRLENLAPRNVTIRELAKKYIGSMKKVQSHGPYCIVGWSLGGTIAFEMAVQLEQTNDEIAFLALIDAPPPYKNLWKESMYYLNLGRTRLNARALYKPSGRIHTPVHYIAASQSKGFKKEHWQKYATGGINYYEIEGDHFSIFKMPGVIGLSKLFSKILQNQPPKN